MFVEPVEPPPSMWVFDDPRDCDPEDDVVGFGADLEPGTLLAAYRLGIFPMPEGGRRRPLVWFSPVRRGVLPLDGLVVSRSLRRSRHNYEIRFDTAFAEVIAACGDSRRPSGWITDDIMAAYVDLHELGWAHSVECWADGELAGGLYGVAIGGLFAGESMFSARRDASKVALAALVDLMSDGEASDRLLDVQWVTPHLASLGVVEVSREEYCARLERALVVPPLAWEAEATQANPRGDP